MNLKLRQYGIKLIYIFIDFVSIYLAIYFACELRQSTLEFDVNYYSIFQPERNPFNIIFVLWMAVTIFYINAKSLYQTKREILEGYEIGLIIRTVVWSTLIIVVVLYVGRFQEFPRSILLIGSGFIILFLSIWRVIKRMFVEYIVTKGYNNFNTLIIGAGKVGVSLAHEIRKRPSLGINIVGFLDDYKTTENSDIKEKILGNISAFDKLAKKEFIDKVFITIHHDNESFLQLIERAKDYQIAVSVIPQGFELITGEFSKYNLGFIPILEYSIETPLRKQLGKRLFDFSVSFVSVFILLPVLIGIAIVLKIDSPGPTFYFSRRYGRNGRVFNMMKFRSMFLDADKRLEGIKDKNEVSGPIFKIKNDPRITPVGKFLRRFSLDELPQFINVIKGEMSLVGPRPLPIDQVEREDMKQLKRLEVRPGITGLWQIKGRSDISFKRLVRWDTWYINNWSFWLDLNILYQTLPVVMKGKGAY